MFNTMIRRICRYLVKKYFGKYLVEFSLYECSLYNGKGCAENIHLNVKALNELFEDKNLPFECLHGSIELVSVVMPWNALSPENTVIDVQGLNLVLQTKERPQDASMFDSMWGNMTSSLQLAEECLNSKDDDEEIEVSDRCEGIQKIAKSIDAFLASLQVRCQDISLKIEHTLSNKSTGISLEIKVASAEYFDEASVNAPAGGHAHESDNSANEHAAYSFKRVVFEGISMYVAEFLSEERSFTSLHQVFPTEGMDPSQFVPGSPEMPPPHTSLPMKKIEPNFPCEPVLISKVYGQQELGLKFKQNEAVIGPKIDIEFNFGAFNLFLTPQQVHLLFTLMNGLLKPSKQFYYTLQIRNVLLNCLYVEVCSVLHYLLFIILCLTFLGLIVVMSTETMYLCI